MRRFERICPSSTQSAPLLYKFAGGTAQSCPPPAPHRVFSHPLQNRMPRGERAPVALCGTSFCSRLGRCLALPTGGSTRGGRRDKILLPCHKTSENTGVSPLFFLHELYGNGMDSAPGFLAWFLRFPTVLIPSSARNAPGFAFFGLCPKRVVKDFLIKFTKKLQFCGFYRP